MSMTNGKDTTFKRIEPLDEGIQVFVFLNGSVIGPDIAPTIRDLIENVNCLVENRDKYVTRSSMRKLLAKMADIKAQFTSTAPSDA